MNCENCANAYDEGYTAGHNAENARLRQYAQSGAATFEDLYVRDQEIARLREQAEALATALRNQGLLQNTFHGTVWHIHDTEPYVSQETRRDTEVYE